MIGTSTYEYLFIQTCIIGLHHVAHLSISYCFIQIVQYALRPALSYRIPLVLEFWAAAETIFYIVVHLCYRQYLQSEAKHPPALSRQGRRELFALCYQIIPDPEAYWRKWFLGAPIETIKRENLKEFFLWGFFNRGGSAGENDEELEEYIAATEKLLGREIEEGRGSAVCLRLTLDPANMLPRSILWYSCIGFVDFLTFCRLTYHGFHFHRTALSRFLTLFPLRPVTFLSRQQSPVKHLTYWHRPHTSRTKLPVVFIHGIGIGLYPYVDFLQELNSTSGIERGGLDEQVGIIAIEIMPVSFRITHQALGKEEICDEIQTIVEHHGFSKYVLTAHSYGTAVATYMLKSERTSNNIGSVVLIDPITILLHLPDVAYNFTRRRPTKANEHQLYYFASMDMGVSHTLARSFFWSDAILWKNDFGDRRVTCSLAQKDLIVNTEAVGRYLTSSDYDSTNHANKNDARNGFMESRGNDYGESDGNGHVKSNSNTYRECNGFAMTNRHIHKDHDTVTNGHAKAHKKEDDYLPNARDWKSRPWRGQGLEILWQNGLDHAQVFDSANRRKGLINAIKTYSARPAD